MKKSTTIAISRETFKELLPIEHEMELKYNKSVSHSDAIKELIDEHNKRKKQ